MEGSDAAACAMAFPMSTRSRALCGSCATHARMPTHATRMSSCVCASLASCISARNTCQGGADTHATAAGKNTSKRQLQVCMSSLTSATTSKCSLGTTFRGNEKCIADRRTDGRTLKAMVRAGARQCTGLTQHDVTHQKAATYELCLHGRRLNSRAHDAPRCLCRALQSQRKKCTKGQEKDISVDTKHTHRHRHTWRHRHGCQRQPARVRRSSNLCRFCVLVLQEGEALEPGLVNVPEGIHAGCTLGSDVVDEVQARPQQAPVLWATTKRQQWHPSEQRVMANTDTDTKTQMHTSSREQR